MHIVLLDATAGPDDACGDGHGVAALARMARREGHRVSHLMLPATERELSAPCLSACASGDVVHMVTSAGRLPMLAHVMRSGQPVVLTLVDLPSAVDAPSAWTPQAGVPDGIQCVVRSHHAAQRWRDAAPGLDPRVLPRGIDLLALLRATSAPPGDAPPTDPAQGGQQAMLVCAGPFGDRSGVDMLLRAFAAVEGAGLRLHLLGGFDMNTAYGQACAALAAADVRVTVGAGPTDGSIAPVARSVDLVCVPSRDPQSFALAVHEAAALGVHCLVSDRGAQADAVRTLRCGDCVAADDESAWTEAISRWLRHHKGRAAAAPTALLPMRLEEEAFLYEGLYRQVMAAHLRGRELGALL